MCLAVWALMTNPLSASVDAGVIKRAQGSLPYVFDNVSQALALPGVDTDLAPLRFCI
jgi:hypothetical protein